LSPGTILTVADRARALIIGGRRGDDGQRRALRIAMYLYLYVNNTPEGKALQTIDAILFAPG
jgi:hypothetical protein